MMTVAGCTRTSLNRLDLGVLAVGLPADRSIPIVNGGKNVAVYHVDSVPDGVGISPMRGRVSPEGRAEIDVHVLLDRPVVIGREAEYRDEEVL